MQFLFWCWFFYEGFAAESLEIRLFVVFGDKHKVFFVLIISLGLFGVKEVRKSLIFILGKFAFRLNVDDEFGSHADFTLNFRRSSHLLDDLLADRQSEAGTLSVSHGAFVEFAEINE